MNLKPAALLFALLVTASACASAPRTRSFQDLPKYLDRGNTITLTETDGPGTTGTLKELSAASLTILTAGNPRVVPEERVVRIQRRERTVGRGALVGLAAGVAVGLISDRSGSKSGSPLVDTQGAAANVAAGILVGTAVGALIGAVVKVEKTVYLAAKPQHVTLRSLPPSPVTRCNSR